MDPELRLQLPTAGPPAARPASADERALVAALLRGDRKAAAEFVAAHADIVHGYIRHRLAPRVERVEDVVQDVFVAALTSLEQFRADASLRAWLLGIARHKVEDYYRRLLREPDALPEAGAAAEPADSAPLLDERLDRERAVERTHAILRVLPESYAVALLWRLLGRPKRARDRCRDWQNGRGHRTVTRPRLRAIPRLRAEGGERYCVPFFSPGA